ncbi:MAG: LysM peptidoglycan-binding domain-containing protein [Actinobacteria bacterium]|nr:LysM peptidoglycan-binding domain-containing protein [Actinomycetota bacterium]
MAAVTTVPGFGALVGPTARVCAPRPATTRGRRVSRATYRRRRLLAAVLVLGAVVVMGEAGVALGGTPLAAPERRPAPSAGPTEVVVRPGDTLWTIVERLHPGDDPRLLVDELSAARNGAPLVVGETIVVP